MSSAASAVVVGHGDFASGIVSAVETISGQGAAFKPMTTAELGAAGIEDMLRAVLNESGIRIVFTDLPSGSATMAVRKLQRSIPDLVVITGTNLPTLLDFAMHAGGESAAAALAALERGKSAMLGFGGTVVR